MGDKFVAVEGTLNLNEYKFDDAFSTS